jgi:hypothetical protein
VFVGVIATEKSVNFFLKRVNRFGFPQHNALALKPQRSARENLTSLDVC